MVDYKRIFQPDSGMLLDMMVFDVTLADFRSLFKHLSSSYELSYSEDGISKPLPDFETISANRLELSARLDIHFPGFCLCCHFFDSSQIEIDLLPEEIDTEQKASSVFDFMIGVAQCLGKEVFLTPEFASATDDERRDMSVCIAHPNGVLEQKV